MSRQDIELVRRIYREWAGGNFRAGSELFDAATTTVWAEEFPTAGTYHGPLQHAKAMRDWLGEWDAFQLEAEDFLEAGESLVVPFRVRARGKGSGAWVERRWAHVWSLRNGRVVRFEVHLDASGALAAARNAGGGK